MSLPTTERRTAFDHVVVGVDGRDGGRDAVALAVALGAHRLTLVGAYAHDGDLTAPATAATERYRDLLRADMTRALEATRMQSGLIADVKAIPEPSPARALHRVAHERRADLIVVGSSHHGLVGQLLLGDVSRAVLHDSPCPVAIAPRGYHEHPNRTGPVAVGFDGRDESRQALALATRLATASGEPLEVHVVREGPTVVIATMAYTDDLIEMDAEDAARAQRVLEQALAEAPEGTTGMVHKGSPVTELAEVGERAGLLILGSRGWGATRRVMLGSTSDRVLHRVRCPVLVVPRGAATDPAGDGAIEATAATR
jgi:nucleotide-binding universal stress UspA family protein